jgi:uncharacterized membrane protein YqgA involved in biofilm formation
MIVGFMAMLVACWLGFAVFQLAINHMHYPPDLQRQNLLAS